ncbi:MAG: hypothetical protein JO316_26245 [Abitibacteriaceae bacterium]|nr:hypothetical protein [Abditibacteriaceae bacterium]MBV9868862.1 hypothetical protein [Abditibacteriaceae bacterium]
MLLTLLSVILCATAYCIVLGNIIAKLLNQGARQQQNEQQHIKQHSVTVEVD